MKETVRKNGKSRAFLLLAMMGLFFVSATPQKETSSQEKLLKEAKAARENAYCPYSHYQVGAALLTKEGKIFRGTNIENASYGLTNCAERAAVASAISQGERDFIAMAVVTSGGGFPCGACRQVLNEFNPDMDLYIADASFENVKHYKLKELLPEAFGPQNLQ